MLSLKGTQRVPTFAAAAQHLRREFSVRLTAGSVVVRHCRGTSSSTPGVDPHRRRFILLSSDAWSENMTMAERARALQRTSRQARPGRVRTMCDPLATLTGTRTAVHGR
jgi:hypothetical protein